MYIQHIQHIRDYTNSRLRASIHLYDIYSNIRIAFKFASELSYEIKRTFFSRENKVVSSNITYNVYTETY